jgi:predicted nucleotidyltransferase
MAGRRLCLGLDEYQRALRIIEKGDRELPRVPAKARALLDDLTTSVQLVLGRDLVGMYLYGSITNSSFNPKRSDIDCIVVTRRRLSETQFRKLGSRLGEIAKLNGWTTRLQVSLLVKHGLLVCQETEKQTSLGDVSCLYQFGVLSRCGSDGNPIIWLDHLRRGKILVGPPAKSFVPEITEEILAAALKRELGYLQEELQEKPDSEWRDVPMYRAYATLTICRILYTDAKGTVVSKPSAASWAIKHFPDRFRAIIERALDYNNTGRDVEIPLRSLRAFLKFAESKLHRLR